MKWIAVALLLSHAASAEEISAPIEPKSKLRSILSIEAGLAMGINTVAIDGAPLGDLGPLIRVDVGYDFRQIRLSGVVRFSYGGSYAGDNSWASYSPRYNDFYLVEIGPAVEWRVHPRVRLGAALLIGYVHSEYSGGDGAYSGNGVSVHGELSVAVDLTRTTRNGAPFLRLSGTLGDSPVQGGALSLGWRL